MVIRCIGYQGQWGNGAMGQWGDGNPVTAQLETAYIHPHNKLGSVSSFDWERLQPVQCASVHSAVDAGNLSACCMAATSVLGVHVTRICQQPQWYTFSPPLTSLGVRSRGGMLV